MARMTLAPNLLAWVAAERSLKRSIAKEPLARPSTALGGSAPSRSGRSLYRSSRSSFPSHSQTTMTAQPSALHSRATRRSLRRFATILGRQ